MGEHRGQDEFRDGPVEGAVGVGDLDGGVPQLVEEQGVHARGGHVDPLQGVGVRPGVTQGWGEKVPDEQDLGPGQGPRKTLRISPHHIGVILEIQGVVGGARAGCREHDNFRATLRGLGLRCLFHGPTVRPRTIVDNKSIRWEECEP